jgi:hypothetical protein
MIRISTEKTGAFHRDGVVLTGEIISRSEVDALRASFERLFRGEFETGIMPDEVNWQQGRSDPALTRQICNGWRADRVVARTVLRADLGRVVAELMGWNGTRIMQDNVLWKPPGAKSLGYHQDDAYLHWFTPGEICTVWIALDDTDAENGTMELVRGSSHWGPSLPEGEFHAPDDYRAPMVRRAGEIGTEPDILFVEVPRGHGSIHHGLTWHGSGPNRGDTPRRSLVLHAMPSDSRYRRHSFAQGTGPIYARYARLDSDEMDENYFPVLWRRDGYRTPGLDAWCRSGP